MILQKEGHPRKPWWLYRCDGEGDYWCGELFWGPPTDAKRHLCADCVRSPASVHFTSGRDTGQDKHDRAYHGGRFGHGEW